MNLKSRKARLPIAVLGACALVTGGGVLTAGSAFAAALTLLPDATSATIVNLDRHTAATNAATDANDDTAYAVKFGGQTSGGTLSAAVTGTAGGTVEFQTKATNGASDDVDANWTPVAVGANGVVDSSEAATDIYYIGSETPGTYTVQFYENVGGGAGYDAGIDSPAPAFTLNVKDVRATTADTADDLSFSVAAPTSILKGEVVAAKTTATLTKYDARGNVTVGSNSVGALGKEISDVLTTGFVGGGATQAAAATTYDGTTFNRTSSARTAATDVVSTSQIGTATKTATTTVTDNSVATVTNENTDTANVDYPTTFPNPAIVRTGTSSVTYTVKAVNGSAAVVSGAKVFFRVLPASGGTTATVAADLTTSAGVPDSDGDVAVNTGADGLAKLTVTTARPADANRYTVAARSNNLTAGTITATYDTAETTSVKSGGNVAAKVGTSVTLTGTVLDQWKQPFNPGSGVTAALTYTNAGAGAPTPTSGNFAIGADGKFSATVSESSSNTTPSTDTYRWQVQTIDSDSAAKNVEWVTSLDAAVITLGSIDTVAGAPSNGGGDSAFPLESTELVDIADHTSVHSATLKAVVKASDNTALKYATFTLSGTEGTYFIDVDGKAVKTLTARTNASGQIGADETTDGVEVVFTKSGTATVTLKSGSITAATPALSVEPATEAWKIVLSPASGKPGSNITVRGRVFDAFGNGATPVATTYSLPNASFGTITSTNPVNSDSSGSSTVIVTTGANDSGVIDSKAVYGGGGTGAAGGTIGVTGLTYPVQVKEATSKITVDNVDPTVVSSAKLTYGSKYYARGALLSGAANPGASVDIYSRGSGEGYQLIQSVTADTEGEWGTTQKISKNTLFLVKSDGKTSPSSLTKIYSAVTLVATSSKADKVTLSANGGPNASEYLYFYRVFANGDTDYLGKKMTNEFGNGSRTFSAPSGNRKYKVLYKAPGTYTGSDTDSVKVK